MANKKESIKPKENLKIVDRGVKSAYTELQKDKALWRNVAIIAIVVAGLASTSFVTTLMGMKPKTYMQVANGKFVPIGEVATLPMDKARVSAFLDEAVVHTLGLDYSQYEEQLRQSKIYYDGESFNNMISELQRSNYLRHLNDNQLLVTVVPTRDYTAGRPLRDRPGVVRISRSYYVTQQSGKTKRALYYIVNAEITRTKNYVDNPWGLAILKFNIEAYNSKEDFSKAVDVKITQ